MTTERQGSASLDGDWPEDFAHENGNYICHCVACGRMFAGHKRRCVCKVCDTKHQARWIALTPEQQAAETQETAAALAKWFALRAALAKGGAE